MSFINQLLLLVAGLTTVSAGITGTNPANGACLCISGNGVNVRSRACGGVIGSVNTGQCFTYTGLKQNCRIRGTNYEFFRFNFRGRTGWAAGDYINIGSNSQCGTNSGGSGAEESGTISWYGEESQGSLTANGERFNINAMTAAHKTLPFNTRIKVKNAANGRTVIVCINDRGPFVDGRILDLSKAAFAQEASVNQGLFTGSYEIL